MVKAIIGGVVLAALVSPAMANEYWVEYNYSTHECSVVEKKSPQSATEAQNGPPPADVTAPGTPKDGSVSDVPQGFAPPTKDMPPVVASGAPNDATTPSVTPGATAPTNTTTAVNPTGAPNGAPTPGAPTDASNADSKNDPFSPLAASWERKKAAAEAAGTATVTTVEIGTAMRSREDAESEMQVMRKCGLKN